MFLRGTRPNVARKSWFVVTLAVAVLVVAYPGTAAGAVSAGLTVDPTGTYSGRTHSVTIRGTFLCRDATEGTALNLNLIQHNGQPNITFGSAGTSPGPCDGQWRPWTLDVSADDGHFTGGTINVDAFVFACDPDVCARFHVNQDVKLVGHD